MNPDLPILYLVTQAPPRGLTAEGRQLLLAAAAHAAAQAVVEQLAIDQRVAVPRWATLPISDHRTTIEVFVVGEDATRTSHALPPLAAPIEASGETVDPTYPYLVHPALAGAIAPEYHTLPPVPAGNAQTACFRSLDVGCFRAFAKGERLQIVLRALLASMNLGKALAQAGHVANHALFTTLGGYEPALVAHPALMEWAEATPQGFGTSLSLDSGTTDLEKLVGFARVLRVPAGLVPRPRLPVTIDAELVRLIPDAVPGETGWTARTTRSSIAWFFGRKRELAEILGTFPLHP